MGKIEAQDLLIRTTSDKLDVVKEDYPDSFIHVHDENEDSDVVSDNLYIGGCRITDNFNIGNMDESIKTNAFGGLESSTLGELKKKSISELFIDVICPLEKPKEKTNSINISYSTQLIKVGDNLPAKDDITISVNNGVWSDGTVYAGECGDVELSMSPDSWGSASDEGKYVISAKGTFAEGGVPKDTHNGECPDLQYKGGEVSSNNITIYSVYPISINSESISEMTEMVVNYYNQQTLYVTIPGEADDKDSKFKIYLPSVFSVFEVKQYNGSSGKYDIDVNMELIDGETSKYIRTNNVTDTFGSAQYEIKLKK